MTEDEAEKAAARVIETCRKIFRRTAETLEAKGVRLEDVAIGIAFAAEDVASRYKGGNHFEAIEWLRTCTDLQERQLFDQASKAS